MEACAASGGAARLRRPRAGRDAVTTEGINWVAQGVTLAPGDRILTTDQEHPGGRVNWDFVAKRYGAAIDVVLLRPPARTTARRLSRVASAIDARTRVMSFSHVLTSTGLRMPVSELCALARRAGCISLVDGAQAVGGIAVDVKQLGCDAYATSGHKWLLGPTGTGLLYLSDGLGDRCRGHRAAGWPRGLHALVGRDQHPERARPRRGDRLRHGDRHRARRGARAGAAPPRARGAVRDRQAARAQPGGRALASPLLTYEVPKAVDAWALVLRLRDAHRIEVKGVPRELLNGQRVSTHLFNDERDVDALAAALRAELADRDAQAARRRRPIRNATPSSSIGSVVLPPPASQPPWRSPPSPSPSPSEPPFAVKAIVTLGWPGSLVASTRSGAFDAGTTTSTAPPGGSTPARTRGRRPARRRARACRCWTGAGSPRRCRRARRHRAELRQRDVDDRRGQLDLAIERRQRHVDRRELPVRDGDAEGSDLEREREHERRRVLDRAVYREGGGQRRPERRPTGTVPDADVSAVGDAAPGCTVTSFDQ